MTPKRYIMIHHSLTKDGATVSWGAIERFHRESNGWADVGYHWGCELIGDSFYALAGRAEQSRAAACPQGDMNVLAVHVCCVGNFDLEAPPAAMLRVLVKRILIPVIDRWGIIPDRIVGHRDYNPAKSCPGRLFIMDALRKLISGG